MEPHDEPPPYIWAVRLNGRNNPSSAFHRWKYSVPAMCWLGSKLNDCISRLICSMYSWLACVFVCVGVCALCTHSVRICFPVSWEVLKAWYKRKFADFATKLWREMLILDHLNLEASQNWLFSRQDTAGIALAIYLWVQFTLVVATKFTGENCLKYISLKLWWNRKLKSRFNAKSKV